MRTYNQLTRDQRYQISYLKAMGHNGKEIAHEIGVHKSTISRELKRNGCEHSYRPKQADEKAMSRKAKSKPRITESTWGLVEEKLRDDWSPEQVSGWLKRYGIRISHEWIYHHIVVDKHSGGNLYIHLRCQKKRRKRYGKYSKRGMIPNRVSIEERPKVVELRERLGDWEVDTLIGKGHRGALVSLVDRKSRFTLIQPVGQCVADSVSQVVISLLSPFTNQVHTITGDNGKEFAKHEQVTEALQAMFFFAHPYSAWERGTSENTNGLIRQYFPKDTDFSKVTDIQAVFVANKLNHRPRKCLGFHTPFEVHLQYTVALES